jgi:hypothetical protein
LLVLVSVFGVMVPGGGAPVDTVRFGMRVPGKPSVIVRQSGRVWEPLQL